MSDEESKRQIEMLIGNINSCRALLQQRAVGMGTMNKQGESYFGILKLLNDEGPLTVPSIATHRKVSRQRIQPLVNEYVLLGDLELITNPEHKRSPLVSLTTQGKRNYRTAGAKVDSALSDLSAHFKGEEIELTNGVLHKLNELLKQV